MYNYNVYNYKKVDSSLVRPLLLKKKYRWSKLQRFLQRAVSAFRKLSTRKSYLLKHGTTWNDLQGARNDLKRPTASLDTTCNKQEMTWNNLQKTNSNFMEPLNWCAPMSHRSNRQFRICNISSHLCICQMMADRKVKAIRKKTKRNHTEKHRIITWLANSLLIGLRE